MKKFYSSIAMALILAGAALTSCDGDDDGPTYDPSYTAAKFIYQQSNDLIETFNLTAGTSRWDTLTLANGMQIIIPYGGNMFTINGVPITGTYQVQVTSMRKPSQMLFSGTNTNYSAGQYLNSAGFFKIDVKKDGASVDKQLDGALIGKIPATNNPNWRLWTADDDGIDQFAWENVNQIDVGQEPNEQQLEGILKEAGFNDVAGGEARNNFVWQDSENAFTFTFTKLNWYNCDMLWNYINNNAAVTVYVNLAGVFGALASYLGYTGDTFVFFVGDSYSVIAQLYTPVTNSRVQSYANSMPTGAKGKLVAFSVKEGHCGYAAKDITISANAEYDMTLNEVSADELKSLIKGLDQ